MDQAGDDAQPASTEPTAGPAAPAAADPADPADRAAPAAAEPADPAEPPEPADLAAPAAAEPAEPERGPELWPRWLVFALLAIAVVLGVVALLSRDALRIKNDLSSGQDALSHLQLTQLDSRQSIDASLGKADRKLRDGANLTRNSIWLKLIAPLPGVGPQIRASRVLTGSTARVGDIAYQAAVKARTQLDAPRSGPAARLHLVDVLRQDLAQVNGQLATVPTRTQGHLTTTLATAQAKLVTKLADAKTQLTKGLTLMASLRTMLAGPRTYLVLAGNNAEMRSGGITTAAGLIHFEGGDLTTGQFISSFDLFLPDPKKVAVPDNIDQMYGWMQPGQEWRTTDTSPNWPEVAKIYSHMSANSPFGKVDGVLFVDVVTLQSVLKVIGPVTVNGFKYSADNVLPQVLFTNYLLYPTADQTNARRDVQSAIARAAFAALRGGGFSLPSLARGLEDDAKGRHLLAWSSNPAEEAMWTQLGADGSIGPDDLLVSVQNVSASKLDFFIKPIVTMQTERFSDHQQVDLYLTVTNPRRPVTSAYIEGGTACCVLPGDQRMYVLYYLPGSAYKITSTKPGFSTVGTDGGMSVVGVFSIVPYSQTVQIHISFYLPLGQTSVTLIPSSRVLPMQYVVNGGFRTNDAAPRKLPI